MKDLNNYSKRILLTGGAGFIGSHVTRYFVNNYPDYLVVVFDALTYCGNLENLKDLDGKDNYIFWRGDIRNEMDVMDIFDRYKITDVIHMAAESHVDRSMTNPNIFAETNIMGTINLLNESKKRWGDNFDNHKFFNMCTDEIFGALGVDDEPFNENTPLDPHSPYSTSKTGQYMYGKTYYEAYGVPVVSLACGNAIGPNQFPEKLVPLTIDRMMNREEIPVYGKGEQMRDWTHVSDICSAIDLVFHKGRNGELYCIGGDACTKNIDIIDAIISAVVEVRFAKESKERLWETNPRPLWRTTYKNLIKFIPDPRGKSHDFRYDLNHDKITNELGWKPEYTFKRSVKETVEWYLQNQKWVEHCKSGEYQKWIDTYYKKQ